MNKARNRTAWAALEPLFRKNRILIIGLGNADRSDDRAGLELAARLRRRHPDRAFAETEVNLERALSAGLEDSGIDGFLFIDAVHFSGSPGETLLLDAVSAPTVMPALSTHQVPMTLILQMIADKGKQAWLLGIEPESLDLFGSMSRPVSAAVDRICEVLEDLWEAGNSA